jgi:dolichol-phosphate mannosyltransferase
VPSVSVMPYLSVVVPVKNEAENIAPLVHEIRTALDGAEAYEIVYVDDGSTDATSERLQSQIQSGAPVRIFRHLRSCGQSAAIWTGVSHARGGVIVTLDGDGQNDPADIPALLARYRNAPEPERIMVAGWRTKRRDGWIKRITSCFANGLRKSLLDDDTPDTGCGIKVFPRQAFRAFPRFDHMHRFFPALMIRGGGEVVSVPVNHRHRERGASNYGTLDRAWVSIWDLMGMIWLLRRGSLPVVVGTNGDHSE